jgi:hypothetical protein
MVSPAETNFRNLALTGDARRLQTFSAVEGRPAVLWS